MLYEQARTRTSPLPWPDAADLTSFIACEQVDSIHARMMRTVWTEPFCTVSGYGEAADRAPFVEEFHQWKVEEEGLQLVLDRAFLMALIEPRALIEVSEAIGTRTARKTIIAAPRVDPESGGLMYDQKGKPQLAVGADGKFIEAEHDALGVTTVVDSPEPVRTGPMYRVLPYRDSLILPVHARDEDEIWGYAKRVFKRKTDLTQQAKDGIYDEDEVAALTDTGDREMAAEPALRRDNISVAPQFAETAEKELWEVLVLLDLNALFDRHNVGKASGVKAGARWYVATTHLSQPALLRFQHDDLDRGRYVPIVLHPRTDRITEGFSFVGHKLITVLEEHTAYRNMGADATSKAVNAPIKRLTGALWDADEQPLGPKSVIDVRSMTEIEPMVMPDVPQSVWMQQQQCENAGRRIGGINDIASGQQVEKGNPTLGEVQMATEQSFVRMDLIVRRAQKAVESLMQIRHAIWKRTLADQPEGVDAPDALMVGLEGRGVPIDDYLPNGKITAALLSGPFRFKPYGSVETADVNRLRADMGQFMQFLGMYGKMFPQMMPILQSPKFARSILRYVGRLYRVPNMSDILGGPAQDLLGQGGTMAGPQMPGMMPPQQGMPQGMPMPPGMPPGPQGLEMIPGAPPPIPMPNPLAQISGTVQ